MPSADPTSTRDTAYAERMQRLATRGGRLRRLMDPQRPYRWNLRRLTPGLMLDIGCGIGRNLRHIDGHGVGVDHNAACVEECRAGGLVAYTPDAFETSDDAIEGRYDSLLFSHVLEHMDDTAAVELVERYLPYLRPGGRLLVITPQARGQRSDSTHVQLIDAAAIERLADRMGMQVASITSFPFPRWAGKWFTYNETVSVLTPPGAR